MSRPIDLNPNHLATVERILADHVPGMRGESLRFPRDLDSPRTTPISTSPSSVQRAAEPEGSLGRLKEAFEESNPANAGGRARLARDIREFPRSVIERDYVVVQEGANETTANGWRKVLFSEAVTGQRHVPTRLTGCSFPLSNDMCS